jgi:hypothetical protein
MAGGTVASLNRRYIDREPFNDGQYAVRPFDGKWGAFRINDGVRMGALYDRWEAARNENLQLNRSFGMTTERPDFSTLCDPQGRDLVPADTPKSHEVIIAEMEAYPASVPATTQQSAPVPAKSKGFSSL